MEIYEKLMEGDHGEEGEGGDWDLRKLREKDNLTSPLSFVLLLYFEF